MVEEVDTTEVEGDRMPEPVPKSVTEETAAEEVPGGTTRRKAPGMEPRGRPDGVDGDIDPAREAERAGIEEDPTSQHHPTNRARLWRKPNEPPKREFASGERGDEEGKRSRRW